MPVKTTLVETRKGKPDFTKLSFGKYFTDHMAVMDYDSAKGGWGEPEIVPYAPFLIDPSAMVFHYGQAVFEGLKAYYSDGKILLFRPERNFARFNTSNERMCIPAFDEKLALDTLIELIKTEREWVPQTRGTSLYIRPFVFATEPALGVHPSSKYKFMIILSPVGAYYATGLSPIKIVIEDEYVRAVRGGVGFTKSSANYAISLKGQEKAIEKGYSQVLWLDGVHHKYIEEIGTTNVFFKFGDTVVTPELNGSILPGVTRDSVITLLKSWGINVVERKISVDELTENYSKGTLTEAFGSGTAAVISPVGEFIWGETRMEINGGKIGELSQRLYDTLTGIQYGEIKDDFGWVREVK